MVTSILTSQIELFGNAENYLVYLEQKIKVCETEIEQLSEVQSKAYDELQLLCTHSNVMVSSRYSPSDYYNPSIYTKITTCKRCLKCISIDEHKGSFG